MIKAWKNIGVGLLILSVIALPFAITYGVVAFAGMDAGWIVDVSASERLAFLMASFVVGVLGLMVFGG